MKNRYNAIIVLFLLLSASWSTQAQWVKCTPLPGDAPVLTTAQLVYLAANGSRIFTTRASAVDSVFYSDDNGGTWHVSNPPGVVIGSTTHYPAIAGVWVLNGKVYLSGSQGTASGTLYLWKSTDNGITWTVSSTGLKGSPVVLYANGNTMYAGTATAGMFLSTDGGATWSEANTGIPKFSFAGFTSYVNVLTIAAIGNDLYIGLGGDISGHAFGIRHTTVGSTTWDSLGTGLPVKVTVPSIVSIGTTLLCRVATYAQGVYKSTDHGATWTDATHGVPAANNLSAGSHGLFTAGNNVFNGTISGDYVSADAGDTWTAVNSTGLPSTFYFNCYAVVGSTLFATTVDASTFPTTSAVWKRAIGQITGVREISATRPTEFTLGQNYPNPFNPSTRLTFDLDSRSTVSLSVYNEAGQVVATLLDRQEMNAGRFELSFDGSQLASGVYYCRLSGNRQNSTGAIVPLNAVRKMMLVR